jgi:HAD superfamily hydrolase (TIGR01509 family)
MIRAVVFDLGGTLLEYKLPGTDWTQFERAGAKAALAHLVSQGHRLPEPEAFVADLVAELQSRWQRVTEQGGNLRLSDLLRHVCARHAIALSLAAADETAHHYVTPLSAQARALPGAKETLQTLRAQGRKIGLISNTMWPGRYHLADLARYELLDYFHHTLFSADVGFWKPQPQIFARSLAALEVTPSEAVFVGDYLPHDIAGAQRAGMRGIHISSGEFSADSVEPDGRIQTLAELPPLIAQWEGEA